MFQTRERLKLAAIALIFHAPGLFIFSRYRLGRTIKLINCFAIALTLGATAFFIQRAGPERSLTVALTTWAIAHFVWGSTLAFVLLTIKPPLRVLNANQWSADDPKSNREMFGRISKSYDFLNTLFSFGLHHRWKRRLVSSSSTAILHASVLDCATGTGDVAFLFEKAIGRAEQVVGIDPCAPLLAIAQARGIKMGSRVKFVEADLLQLPFTDASFDVVSISFGIRNVSNPQRAIEECARVLKRRGILIILESGEPEVFMMKRVWNFYFRFIVVPVGFWITGTEAYRYLYESSRQFPAGKQFLSLVEKQNNLFLTSEYRSMGGGATYLYRFVRK